MLDFDGLLAHNGAINGFQSAVSESLEYVLNIAVLTNCHPVIGFGDVATELAMTVLSS